MTFRGDHVDELISASLTGELTDAERLELEAHLVRCETCRATLAAFTAERRILSGLPVIDPPRDLSARVRTGIESGRSGSSWWRRPGGLIAVGASLATVAAAVLAVVVIGNLDLGGVGQQSGSPAASVSLTAAPSAVETTPASTAPTPVPAFELGPGELGYLSLNGAPFESLRLSFVNDANGETMDAGTVSGPPLTASLSPDGRWLAYITQKGETGANEVWALDLAEGGVTHLGCSSAEPFIDRLAWSSDSRYLAYTLVGIALGPEQGCQTPSDGADVWLFDTTANEVSQFTTAGNAYAADWWDAPPQQGPTLLLSYAAAQPHTVIALPGFGIVDSDFPGDGMFLPLFSPDGNLAIFWNGTMTSNGGSWHFSVGGMPQLSGDFRSAGPSSSWIGTPLFTDLTPVGGEAFASGKFAWGPDSDLIAFWDGAWTGVPQSADGEYPNQLDVYLGRVSGPQGRVSGPLLSSASRLDLGELVTDGAWIVDVALSLAPGDAEAAVTIGLPSAGIGDPPSALLVRVTSASVGVGGGVEPPPWQGPAVYGY
jgi:hypothetical protein